MDGLARRTHILVWVFFAGIVAAILLDQIAVAAALSVIGVLAVVVFSRR